MKILVNDYDKELIIESLEEAKNYFKPSEEETEEASESFKEYAQEIEEAESLEELADILTSNSDNFGNGSIFSVKEI